MPGLWHREQRTTVDVVWPKNEGTRDGGRCCGCGGCCSGERVAGAGGGWTGGSWTMLRMQLHFSTLVVLHRAHAQMR